MSTPQFDLPLPNLPGHAVSMPGMEPSNPPPNVTTSQVEPNHHAANPTTVFDNSPPDAPSAQAVSADQLVTTEQQQKTLHAHLTGSQIVSQTAMIEEQEETRRSDVAESQVVSQNVTSEEQQETLGMHVSSAQAVSTNPSTITEEQQEIFHAHATGSQVVPANQPATSEERDETLRANITESQVASTNQPATTERRELQVMSAEERNLKLKRVVQTEHRQFTMRIFKNGGWRKEPSQGDIPLVRRAEWMVQNGMGLFTDWERGNSMKTNQLPKFLEQHTEVYVLPVT